MWGLQTAGYHVAPGGSYVAEAVLQDVKNVEELRDFILNMVRRLRPVAVEAGAEVVSQSWMNKYLLS